MLKITEKLNTIKTAKDDIKTAIENKGVVVGDVSISEYAKKIDAIQGGTPVEINDCSYLFYYGARTEQLNDILKYCNNVTNMKNMFYNNYIVEEIDLSDLDTTNLIDMGNAFYSCSNLTKCICRVNTANVTSMNSLFMTCPKLKELDISTFDTNNVTDMTSMFNGNAGLTSLDLSHFNTPKLKYINTMFGGCSTLKDLNLGSFDASNIIGAKTIISSCTALENLIFMNNYGKGFTQKSANYSNYTMTLSSSNNLTHDSLMDVINKLYDLNLSYNVAGGGTLRTQKLVLGSTNLAKLTADEIAIATNKGWVVS